MSSLSLGLVSQADASTGVHDGRLLDDETIPLQTSNVAARVGQGNFVGLVGIQPNLALSALEDGGGEALLELKIDCKLTKKDNNTVSLLFRCVLPLFLHSSKA